MHINGMSCANALKKHVVRKDNIIFRKHMSTKIRQTECDLNR